MEFFTEKSEIQTAIKHAKNRSIMSLFNEEHRVDNFSLKAGGLFLDYSKQNIRNTRTQGYA